MLGLWSCSFSLANSEMPVTSQSACQVIWRDCYTDSTAVKAGGMSLQFREVKVTTESSMGSQLRGS